MNSTWIKIEKRGKRANEGATIDYSNKSLKKFAIEFYFGSYSIAIGYMPKEKGEVSEDSTPKQ